MLFERPSHARPEVDKVDTLLSVFVNRHCVDSRPDVGDAAIQTATKKVNCSAARAAGKGDEGYVFHPDSGANHLPLVKNKI